MKKGVFLLLVMMLLGTGYVRAQFFDFGWSNPFGEQRVQQQERIKQPEFKGGTEGIRRFQRKHFKAPYTETPLEGQIVIACIISEKGKVIETYVVRSVNQAFDTEAQRVCHKMKFKPAMRGKKKVKSRFDIVFPIRHSRLSFSTLQTIDV